MFFAMQKEIKDLMPKWSLTKQDRNLTLTNDFDSLTLSNLLKDLFGYEVNHFYSFKKFATLDRSDKRLSIGCDLAINKGYTFCNHLVMPTSNGFKNPDSVNLNNALNISNDQYYKKFNLSSLVTAWSLYDIPLPKTEEGKMILLAIDSAYMGWRNPKYQYIMAEWLERLEMTELIDLLKKYSQADFSKFQISNQLHTGIGLNKNGELAFRPKDNPYAMFGDGLELDWMGKHLGFPIELPKGQFTVTHLLEIENTTPANLTKPLLDKTFSMAITFKDQVRLSMLKKGESA